MCPVHPRGQRRGAVCRQTEGGSYGVRYRRRAQGREPAHDGGGRGRYLLLSPLLRPLAKTAIKGGIVAYDWAANTVTEVMEEAREAAGEAAGEHEARRRESAVAARAAAQKPSEPKPATP